MSEYSHNYYLNHSQKYIDYAKRYHKNHYSKDKLRQMSKDTYYRHHDDYLNKAKRWKKFHPLQVKKTNHQYYLKHKHQFAKYQHNRRSHNHK